VATKNKKVQQKKGQVPSPGGLSYPASEFDRFKEAKLVELDRFRAEHEAKWGIGRISTLVPTEFREKFYAQSERIWAAQNSQDVSRMAAACDGMIRAYKAMDAWAIAEGMKPITKVHAIEADTHLGIMVIVKDEADAVQYQALRQDVRQVWTVAEIVELVKAGIGQAIWEMKEQLPVRGAVVAVQQEEQQSQQKAAGEAVGGDEDRKRPLAKPVASGGGSGFEDLENDLDLDEAVDLPKMWNAPPEAKKR
jgi:hypothetical protein